MKKILMAAAAALFAAVLSPAQATIVGTVDTNPFHSNAAPFGNLQASFFYQQVFDDSAFNAPVNINQLTFYNTVTPGGAPNPGAFQIYLGTTTQTVGAIVNNIPDFGALTSVFDGLLPAVSNGRLDFTLASSFFYDPLPGTNLLMVVRNFNFSASPSPLFLDSDTTGLVTSSRHYSGPNGASGNLKSGLVTGFNDAVAVPEPSTWAMMIMGVVFASFFALRRKTDVSPTAV